MKTKLSFTVRLRIEVDALKLVKVKAHKRLINGKIVKVRSHYRCIRETLVVSVSLIYEGLNYGR